MLEQLGEWTAAIPSRPVAAIIGIVLLLFGRKVYWLLLLCAGFLVGWTVALSVNVDVSDSTRMLVAFGCGVVAALLALFAHRLALAIAGFVLGGFAALWLLGIFAVSVHGGEWLVALIGAVIGLFAFRSMFELALIVVSSLVGAAFVVQAAGVMAPLAYLFLGVLFLVGFFRQRRSGSKAGRRAGRKKTHERPQAARA